MAIPYPKLPEMDTWANIDETVENRVREKSTITDSNMADWAIRYICHLRGQMDFIESIYNDQRSQLELYRAREKKRIASNEQYWLDRLEEYFATLKESGIIGPKEKGFNLPHGRLQTRKQFDKWDFSEVDVEQLGTIDPEMVRIKMEVDVEFAKTQFAYVDGKVYHVKSGQLVEGVKFIPGQVGFDVKST